MDYETLQGKRDYLQKNKGSLPEPILKNYEDTFAVEYTHNSTAIEGNTLSLMETKLVLENQQAIIRILTEMAEHHD
jgi:hypothetical protein